MERVFTPWRMEYIRRGMQAADPGPSDKGGCIFCDMLVSPGDRDALIVHRGEHAYLVLNKYPYNNGHFMVVPYRHVNSVEALSSHELANVMELVTLGMRALRASLRPEGFNIGANIGKVAGAGIQDHVHMHVVPRWGGDANFMAVIADVKLIPQSLLETYDLLKAAVDTLLA